MSQDGNGKIDYEDNDRRSKIKNGNVLLTIHRILFYIDSECLEIPLFNVSGIEKLGGLLQKAGVKLNIYNQGNHSPNVIDYYQNVLRR